MTKLYFMNHGEFDVRAMLTFGVSAKEKENAIGFFGTGAKIATAIILRLGGTIRVDTNGKEYVFEVRKETIRSKEFDIVYMNGQEVGFTTHLGINWEPWQAFREFYCNCKDEDGVVSYTKDDKYTTCVTIESDEINEAYEKRNMYFIENKTPFFSSQRAQMYNGETHNVYYRGVAVMSLRKHALFTYDIKNTILLTEDRTAKDTWTCASHITHAIQNCTHKAAIRKIIQAPTNTFEGELYYSDVYGISPEFLEVAQELRNTTGINNESLRKMLQEFDDKFASWEQVALTTVQQKQLDKALTFLQNMKFNITEFPIKIVEGLGQQVMGRAHEGTIYISQFAFQLGTKQLAGTLLEEWLHLKENVEDFDRRMQNWLFDKIISLGEEIIGEPI